MKLTEIQLDPQDMPDGEDDSLAIDLPNNLEHNEVYAYEPKSIIDAKGHPQNILTLWSFHKEHTGKKSYAIHGEEAILMEILKTTHLETEEDRVQRIRIMSNVDQKVSRFSLVNQHFTRNVNGETITFKLKDLPDFDNYDKYSDDEFLEKFGRRRLVDDHGLVGHVWLDDELVGENPTKNADSADSGAVAQGGGGSIGEPAHISKMDQALQIYKSNHQQGRKRVIHLFQQLIGLTPAGASSYYTRAKNTHENKVTK